MKYRPYGSTGLQISEIVFGGGAVGGILIDADDDTRRAAIRKALDGGINWIDTAPLYGGGRSEEALGWLLNEIPADGRPHLSTKVRIDPGAGDVRGQVERSMQESLRRLRRESVDVLLLHNSISDGRREHLDWLPVDDVLGPDGVAEGLQRIADQGLTRFVGFTATGDRSALHTMVESDRFNAAQVYYNLLNPSAGRAVPADWPTPDYGNLIDRCAAHGVAVMNIRVLAAGVIATDVRHGREAAAAPVRLSAPGGVAADEARTKVVVDAVGDRYGTRAQLAIRYALANPNVSGVLVGMAELSHLDEALTAAEMGPLPQEGLDAIHELVDSGFGGLEHQLET